MEWFVRDLQDLPKVAAELIASAGPRLQWLFYGEMGAGKTTLITEILRQLGVSAPDGSPTYALINRYDTDKQTIYHMDLYRLKSAREAFDIGLDDIFGSHALCLIEWPQIGESLMDDHAARITIELQEDLQRKITLNL